jgi:hypothetical protein
MGVGMGSCSCVCVDGNADARCMCMCMCKCGWFNCYDRQCNHLQHHHLLNADKMLTSLLTYSPGTVSRACAKKTRAVPLPTLRILYVLPANFKVSKSVPGNKSDR